MRLHAHTDRKFNQFAAISETCQKANDVQVRDLYVALSCFNRGAFRFLVHLGGADEDGHCPSGISEL
jgi:hypothetical protein